MQELKHKHQSHGDPNGGPIHQGHPPYWRRAHRDWRVWVGVVLMLAAMAIYLASNERVSAPHFQPQPPISNIPGK